MPATFGSAPSSAETVGGGMTDFRWLSNWTVPLIISLACGFAFVHCFRQRPRIKGWLTFLVVFAIGTVGDFAYAMLIAFKVIRP